jgi:endonuclease YncB( thermonuclease family)
MPGSRMRAALAGTGALLVLCLAACAPFEAGAQQPQTEVVGRASVVDGDTIEIRGTRIRLFGIDAPESGQSCTDREGRVWPCGRRAAQALDEFLQDKTVRCREEARDRWRRMVAVCIANREDAGRYLVLQGHAVAYRQYSTRYVADEQTARAADRGIWAGTFVMPWEYRRQRRAR